MPRVIFKCPYLKGGGATATHRRLYVKYIATREGARKIDAYRKPLAATGNQKEMIARLLRDFRPARDLFEYEDYAADPTGENASAFISAALELAAADGVPFAFGEEKPDSVLAAPPHILPGDPSDSRNSRSALPAAPAYNPHATAAARKNYVGYIAVRPRAERVGTHGLFTAPGVPVVLEQAANEAAAHPGHVWAPIFSLRREDAARLGYDSAGSWQALLSSFAPDLAKHLKIQPDNFRWYAAYHDEGHHPHVQMVCWSSDPAEGFLTRDGIRSIKAGIAGRIFRRELTEIFQRQTLHRGSTAEAARQAMKQLAAQMENGVLHSDHIECLILHLASRLRFHSGKKQYGYLKAPLKAVVNGIVDELAKDERVAEAYRLWCDMRLGVLRTYQKNPPHPGPLSAQKEFNHVRNIVIAEAAQLAGQVFTFEQEAGAIPAGLDDGEPPAGAAGDEALEPDAPEPETAAEDRSDHCGGADASTGQTPAQAAEPGAPAAAEPLPRAAWSDAYRQAKKYLYGQEGTPRDFAAALRLFTEEALAGNALAMHDLGRMYADGLGTDADPAAAQKWYAKALAAFIAAEGERENRYTEYRIGKMYAAGLGAERDHSEAAAWFRESADRGYKYGQYSLAGLLYNGKGVEKDCWAAFGLYTKAAAQGFPYADFELGKMCRDGTGTAKDAALAASHFRHAFNGFVSLERQSHDDKLQYRLGRMLENGAGTEKDVPAATVFYEKAAGLGNPRAQYAWAKLILKDETAPPAKTAEAAAMLQKASDAGSGAAVYALAKLCRDGQSVEKDIHRAAALFERAATEFENGYAAFALGKLCLAGEELPKDAGAAIRWFTKAANQGNPYAQYTLGMLYLKGEDAPKDAQTAAILLERAAAQGNEYAAYRLGKLYLTGEDVPKDTAAAVRCFTQAAESGNQFAEYTLGKLYLLGKDVPRNRDAALRWLTLAAAQGNIYAQFFIDHFDQWRDPSAFLAASRLLYHLGGIFRDSTPPSPSGTAGVTLDRKLLRKLREKKIAQGHAADDHAQEPVMRF